MTYFEESAQKIKEASPLRLDSLASSPKGRAKALASPFGRGVTAGDGEGYSFPSIVPLRKKRSMGGTS